MYIKILSISFPGVLYSPSSSFQLSDLFWFPPCIRSPEPYPLLYFIFISFHPFFFIICPRRLSISTKVQNLPPGISFWTRLFPLLFVFLSSLVCWTRRKLAEPLAIRSRNFVYIGILTSLSYIYGYTLNTLHLPSTLLLILEFSSPIGTPSDLKIFIFIFIFLSFDVFSFQSNEYPSTLYYISRSPLATTLHRNFLIYPTQLNSVVRHPIPCRDPRASTLPSLFSPKILLIFVELFHLNILIYSIAQTLTGTLWDISCQINRVVNFVLIFFFLLACRWVA